MKIGIHQPNFFPWGGYFEKIKQCDKFIFLVNCPFSKGSYTNRFNIEERWYTMTLEKKPIGTFIKDMIYKCPEENLNTIKNRLEGKRDLLNCFDGCFTTSLMETNINIIKKICEIQKIKTEFLYDYETNKTSTERLIDIIKKNEGTSYISGKGGDKYMDMNLFKKSNIELKYSVIDKKYKRPILDILNISDV